MGGELGLESAPGQGSRFHFRLPLALPAEPEPAPTAQKPWWKAMLCPASY